VSEEEIPLQEDRLDQRAEPLPEESGSPPELHPQEEGRQPAETHSPALEPPTAPAGEAASTPGQSEEEKSARKGRRLWWRKRAQRSRAAGGGGGGSSGENGETS